MVKRLVGAGVFFCAVTTAVAIKPVAYPLKDAGIKVAVVRNGDRWFFSCIKRELGQQFSLFVVFF